MNEEQSPAAGSGNQTHLEDHQDDLNVSMESDQLDPEQKAASEADTLPMDGRAPPPTQVKTKSSWFSWWTKSFREVMGPFLVSQNPLPDNPTRLQRLVHSLRWPPHGRWARLLTLAAVVLSLWASCIGMFGEVAKPPSGTLFILIIMVVFALMFGWVFSLMHLPPLLGMLITGIVIKNIPGVEADEYWTKSSSILRGIALVVILMRAGLGLDPVALKRLSGMVFRLAFTPCLVETATVAIASHLLLDFPWLWGLMLGFVLAAVSPAVVVPCLLSLQERGFGVAKGIPTLVIAAASVDDVLAISGFTILLGITFKPNQDMLSIIFQGPKEALIGLVFGTVWAAVAVFLPGQDDPKISRFRFAILFLGGLLAYFGSKSVELAGAGALAVLVMAFVAGIGWRKLGWTDDDNNPVSQILADLWIVFQPILFGLIGTEIQVNKLDANTVGLGVLVLVIGLVLRIVASYLAVLGGNLTLRERIFVSLAWLPKATVQAALGPVALDTLYSSFEPTDPNFNIYKELGLKVLTIAVLVILITAPIGAVAITVAGPRLLSQDKKKDDDVETG